MKEKPPKVVPIRGNIHDVSQQNQQEQVEREISKFLQTIKNSEDVKEIRTRLENIHKKQGVILGLKSEKDFSFSRYSKYGQRGDSDISLVLPENQSNLFSAIRNSEIGLARNIFDLTGYFWQVINEYMFKEIVEKCVQFRRKKIKSEGVFSEGIFGNLEKIRAILLSFQYIFKQDPNNRDPENTDRLLKKIQEFLNILDGKKSSPEDNPPGRPA